MKKLDFKFFTVFLIVMTIIYLLSRYAFLQLYTPEWVARQLFVYILTFLTVISLLGYRKFVTVSVIGYVTGIISGELFGGFESDIGPQYLHWGWLIFIVVFILFCIIGFMVENKSKIKNTEK